MSKFSFYPLRLVVRFPSHSLYCVLSAVCCLLYANSCAYAPLRPTAASPLPLPAEIAAYYDYPKQQMEPIKTPLRENAKWREWLVQFPLAVSGFEPTEPMVEFEWFESTQPLRRPAIVFNPILGGDYPLERGICRFLARNGYHTAMIHRKTLKISPEHKVEHLELLLRQGILRIRQVVDWMELQPEVDPERLGSFGISMGGIASVITAAVEPRLKAHMVALPGGSIPDILLTSKDSLLTKPLKRYMEANHIDRLELEKRLQQHVRTDPLRLAPYVDPHKIFLFVALADRTIGRANSLRLWMALGRPKVVFLPLGHYTAYLSLPYLKYESLRFFKETL